MAGKRVTIYIRADNLHLWEQIENKSEWLNDLLDGTEPKFERRIRAIVKETLDEMQQGNY